MTEQEDLLIEKMVAEYRIKLKAMVCSSEPRTGFKVQEVDFKGHAQIIADYFGIDYNTMLSSKTRQREYILARSILFWLTRKQRSNVLTFTKIAEYAGLNHATIIHSIKKFNEWYEWDNSFKHPVDDIMQMLGYKVVKEGKENYHPELL
jgi:chromosomal replication initiation ATPase DnaA